MRFCVSGVRFEVRERGDQGGRDRGGEGRSEAQGARQVGREDGGESGDEDSEVTEAIVAARKRVEGARSELRAVERYVHSETEVWERLAAVISESRTFAATWEAAGPEQRKALLDYWAYDVTIVSELIGGKSRPGVKRPRKARKTAILTLRTAPGAPKIFELGLQPGMDDSAALSSVRTDGSDSTDCCANNASLAAGEPILPSAHAACDRTSSGSVSASANAGTSSDVPALPSTTAAFRRKPRRLARFIGEPLNAAENPSCDIASTSSANVLASLPATAGRGAYGDPSANSLANFRLNGHTSW